MALSESNITRNSYNAFLVLLRFSFILFHALALLIRAAFERSLGTVCVVGDSQFLLAA